MPAITPGRVAYVRAAQEGRAQQRTGNCTHRACSLTKAGHWARVVRVRIAKAVGMEFALPDCNPRYNRKAGRFLTNRGPVFADPVGQLSWKRDDGGFGLATVG